MRRMRSSSISSSGASCGSSSEVLPSAAMSPADAVTASGSGLDSNISLTNAGLQIPRVAKARGLSEERIRELVKQNTHGRDLGVFGEPRVNIMTLNFTLDQLSRK